MAIFFYLGSRWREDPPPSSSAAAEPGTAPGGAAPPVRNRNRSVAGVAAAAIALALAPAAFASWTRPAAEAAPVALAAPRTLGAGRRSARRRRRGPTGIVGPKPKSRGVYERTERWSSATSASTGTRRRGRTAIHFANVIVPRGDSRWRIVAERDTTLTSAGRPLPFHETDVRSLSLGYAVWHVFWLPDEFTVSRTRAKLLQARERLLGRHDHAAIVILSSPYADRPERARARPRRFNGASSSIRGDPRAAARVAGAPTRAS